MADSPVIITLTLPTDAEPATMLIQRGDLAHVRRFAYEATGLAQAIQDAYIALTAVEAAPPVIPAPPEPPKPAPRPAVAPAPASKPKPKEPTLRLTIGKRDFVDVPERFVQGLDANQTASALPLIAKLIEGKLWDGKSPILISDANNFEKKLKHLSAKELVLFSLSDFVQPGENILWVPPADSEQAEPIDEPDEADEPEEEEGEQE